MGGCFSKPVKSVPSSIQYETKVVYRWRIRDHLVPYDLHVSRDWLEDQMKTLCDGHAFMQNNFSVEEITELKVVVDKRTIEVPK
jgi:hypothetical protein